MAMRIEYRSGGNPPLAAGLFSVRDAVRKKVRGVTLIRLAWWPEGVEPTPSNIDIVVTELVWKRVNNKPITREQINELFRHSLENPVTRGAYRRR
jgi:hypothetical protein